MRKRGDTGTLRKTGERPGVMAPIVNRPTPPPPSTCQALREASGTAQALPSEHTACYGSVGTTQVCRSSEQLCSGSLLCQRPEAAETTQAKAHSTPPV